MNIFYLSVSTIKAAQMLVDRHVVKMLLESTQLLANVYHMPENADLPKPLTKSGQPYRACHWNHPCSVWVRASENHFHWLLMYTVHLSIEYRYRFSKGHACEAALDHICLNEPSLPKSRPCWVDPPQCMPDQYKQSDTVQAYRAYYVGEKSQLFKWTRRSPPKFISGYSS